MRMKTKRITIALTIMKMLRGWVSVFALFMVFLLHSSCGGSERGDECGMDEDCLDDEICVHGMCKQVECEPACGDGFTCVRGACLCEGDWACPEGEICDFGECRPGTSCEDENDNGGEGGVLPDVPEGVMTLPENRWTRIGDVPPDPFARELAPGRGAFLSYEPMSGRFLRYGGYTPTDCNSLWTYDLVRRRWENPLQVDYDWPPPADRPGAGAWWSMARDSKRNVVWFFGGWGLVGRTHPEVMRDVWKYDPVTKEFTAMNAENTPGIPIDGLPIVYDASNDLLVLAPGARSDPRWDEHLRGKTFVYDPGRNVWETRDTPEMPMRVRMGPNVMVYAPCIGKTVYLENDDHGGPATTWTYDAAENIWEVLQAGENPPGRVVAGSAYDPVNKAVLVVGGAGYAEEQSSRSAGYLNTGNGVPFNDTWILDLSDPAQPQWRRICVGAPVIPELPGQTPIRFEIMTAMDYDVQNRTFVLAAPTMGVWALRYRPQGGELLPDLSLEALPAFPEPETRERVFPMADSNERLLNLDPGTWVELGGGRRVGGNEVPVTYDESTGFVLSYGGCGSGGTTFASRYSNALSAYDPATERWIALRWYDVCAPPRHRNGCNMFTAYDTKRERTYIYGGTAQNQLARSILPDWEGGPYIWSYHGLSDRFEMIPLKEDPPAMGNGTCTSYDPLNDLFVINLGSYWDYMFAYDPQESVWRNIGQRRHVGYSFATYVDTLQGIFSMHQGEPVFLDAAKGEWRVLPSHGEQPQVEGSWERRSSSAYSPDGDVVMSIGARQAWLYNVQTGIWTHLGEAPHCQYFDNHVVYDKRHKVFLILLGMARNQGVWAYRLEE